METKVLAIINFVYFLANYPGSFSDIIATVWPDNPGLVYHLKSKLTNTTSLSYNEIIKWFFELSASNQRIFVEWVETNYHYCEFHRNQN